MMQKNRGYNMSQKQLMDWIDQISFVLDDTLLYLDTHPCCGAGLAKFQQARQAYCQAVDAYTAQYGPLRFEQSDGCGSWQWVEAPWPWELED